MSVKKAQTISELVNNLFIEYLTPNEEEFYVPVYENKLKRIRISLLEETYKPNQTLYVTGQSGSGKTTALNFLPDAKIHETFKVVNLYGHKLFDLNDLDIIDFLLQLSFELIRERPELQSEFEQQLILMQGKHRGSLNIESVDSTEGEASIKVKSSFQAFLQFLGLVKAGIDLSAELRMNAMQRRQVREAFTFNIRDLFEMTDRIIQKFIDLSCIGKALLLIINELDHIKKWDLVEKLFIDNRFYFESLKCKKVITIPVILTTVSDFMSGSDVHLGLKLQKNPVVESTRKSEEEIDENHQLMEKIVRNRIHDDFQKMITPDAISLAIEHSGGNISQYLNILIDAGRNTRLMDSAIISKTDVEYGINERRQRLEPAMIFSDTIRVLEHFRTQHTPFPGDRKEDKDIFIRAILGNQVYAYINQPTWYDVNPLIRKTVEIYAARIKS
jgi:hypothetical protein